MSSGPARVLELLSWGFPKIPLHRGPALASTPRWLPTLRPEVASLVLVPPLPFLPASTVFSARTSQVCCTLHPIMGFGPFRVGVTFAPRGVSGDPLPPRDRGSHPSELSPRRRPYRVSAALASSPFWRASTEVDRPSTSRLFSADESVVGAGVATSLDPLLSWASLPSRVLPECSVLSGSTPRDAGRVLDRFAHPPTEAGGRRERPEPRAHPRIGPPLGFHGAGFRRSAALRRPLRGIRWLSSCSAWRSWRLSRARRLLSHASSSARCSLEPRFTSSLAREVAGRGERAR